MDSLPLLPCTVSVLFSRGSLVLLYVLNAGSDFIFKISVELKG